MATLPHFMMSTFLSLTHRKDAKNAKRIKNKTNYWFKTSTLNHYYDLDFLCALCVFAVRELLFVVKSNGTLIYCRLPKCAGYGRWNFEGLDR
jgi:hypothetical protein